MVSTLVELRRLLGEAAVGRGLAYVRQGRVREIAAGPDGRIEARVQGTRRAPYVQEIRLTHDRRGVLSGIDGRCSCPVTYNCKHVAAALIAREQAGAGPQDAAPSPSLDPLPPSLRHWLTRVRQADAAEATASGADDDAYLATVRDRLLYVLDLDRVSGRLVAVPMKGTLRKDGTLGRTVRRYHADRLGWEAAPRFVRPVDLRILHRIEVSGLHASHLSHGRAPPEPGEVLALLETIAGTGRGRWGEAQGPVLAIGRPRRGAVEWVAGEDGGQRPRLVDGEGAAIALLPVEPPAYADPATGAIGPLGLDLPPKVAAAMLAAPDVPPEAAGAVAEALAALRHARAPAPKAIRSETHAGVAPVPVLRLFGLALRHRHGRWGTGASVTLPALRLAFDYGGRRVAAFPYADPRFREGDTVVTLVRDRAAEERAHRRIAVQGTERADALDHLGPGRTPRRSTGCSTKMMTRGARRSPSPPRRCRSCAPRAGGSRSSRAGPSASTRAPRRSARALRAAAGGRTEVNCRSG